MRNKRTLYCIDPWKLCCLTEETLNMQQQQLITHCLLFTATTQPTAPQSLFKYQHSAC